MPKENISLSQLLTLLINFLLGSAVVVGIGTNAKNDAWIAISIAMFIGAGVIWFYHLLLNRQSGKNLFQLFEIGFGRALAIFFSFLYVLYFLYIACRDLRDFEELIASALMPNTPVEVIAITFSLLMGYVIYLGIEVLARTSEIFTPYLLGFLILMTIFLFGSGHIQFDQLQPILAEGFLPVAKTSFIDLLFFPYGEMIVFTVILCNVTKQEHRLRVSMMGVGIASFLLVVSTVLQLTTIGNDTVQRSNFPLLSAARSVSIGNFIERVDALIVFIIMLGVFVKGSIFLYCGLKGLEYITNLPFRYFAIPISLILSIFSILVSYDFADHIQEGLKLVPYYLHLPFQFCIPVFLFGILIWKQRKRGGTHEASQKAEASSQ